MNDVIGKFKNSKIVEVVNRKCRLHAYLTAFIHADRVVRNWREIEKKGLHILIYGQKLFHVYMRMPEISQIDSIFVLSLFSYTVCIDSCIDAIRNGRRSIYMHKAICVSKQTFLPKCIFTRIFLPLVVIYVCDDHCRIAYVAYDELCNYLRSLPNILMNSYSVFS